jgi:putative phage-type endonuclease
MKSELIRVSTLDMPPGSKGWLDFRLNGIGGSEVAAILGLNPYSSSHKLFYQKLQEVDYDPENVHMFWGKEHEDKIAEIWEFHDPANPAFENTMQNRRENKTVRKCRRVNAYIINPEFPNLFASVDRLINKGDNEKEGILECKTISAYAAKIWDVGIPPMYIAQLQFYLLVCELEYGELATLKDGKYFEVLPFERNEQFFNLIKEASAEFWDRVTRARILKQEGKPYEQLEPEIDNQEAYKIFLTERYKAEQKTIKAELHYFDLGKRHIEIGEKIKELKSEQDMVDNQIKEYMKESDTMDFGASGKITFKEQKGKQSMNLEAFMEEQPELFGRYVTTGNPFRVLRIGLKLEKKEEKAVAA